MNVIETHALGKSYGSTRALYDCTLAIPDRHVVALVGPNGAGKTTLLNLTVGLVLPTTGEVTVLGGRPAGSLAALYGIAFVAQDAPLYKNLSAADLLHETRNLNRRFDQDYAEHRLGELGIPLRQKAGKLSGGQQAQLALTLALARRPQLLLLDEPEAMLDPVARHDFMATVLTAAAARPPGAGCEPAAGAVAADGLGHLAAAPLRAGRSGRAAGRAGGVAVAGRPSRTPRLRRRGRLPPGKLGCLRKPGRLLPHLRLDGADHRDRAAGGARADRGVRRRAGAGPGDGERHLPVRLDAGLRPVALDARQASAPRDRGGGRRRGVQPAVLLVLPAVLDPDALLQLPGPAGCRGVRPARGRIRRLDAGRLRDRRPGRHAHPPGRHRDRRHPGRLHRARPGRRPVPARALSDAAAGQEREPARLRMGHRPAVVRQGRPAGQPERAQPGPPGGAAAGRREGRDPAGRPHREPVPRPARVHAVDDLPAGQPLLAIPVDRGRLAARAVGTAHRRHRLAGPPPRRLSRHQTDRAGG